MTAIRFICVAFVSYNIGAEAVRATLSCLAVWGIVEFVAALHARREARRRSWRRGPVVLRPFDRRHD